MPHRITAVLFLLLIAFQARTQQPAEPLRLPKEITGLAEKAIEIQAETMGKHVRFRVMDAGLILIWDLPDLRASKRALCFACKPGRYRVEAWTSFNDEPSQICSTTIIILGPTPPDPPPLPPVPPPTPPPVDPLTAKLQAAYSADPGTAAEKESQRVKMIGLYQAMVDHTALKSITVAGDLLSDYKATADSILVKNLLIGTRTVVAAEVAAVFGTSKTAPLDDAMRARGVELFKRLAKSMWDVK